MSYGIYINGRRPKSKKEVKEAIADAGQRVRLENTSLFGGYDGDPHLAPPGKYDFVGPDPYTKRNFYGNVVVTADRVYVT